MAMLRISVVLGALILWASSAIAQGLTAGSSWVNQRGSVLSIPAGPTDRLLCQQGRRFQVPGHPLPGDRLGHRHRSHL